jgi:ATP-dependent exoDNAse (exonuclease V) beta subunit
VSAPPLADAADRALICDTALDDTLVVEAAAGTGKTTMLVQRIVRIIATGRAEIAGIVAVTFTEKAAGELKLRLREGIERAQATAPPPERACLEAALRRLEEAHVTTIHGFCADLLRERPVEAGIDPVFTVLTEPQSSRLYDGVFDRWLQRQLADPPEGVRRALRRHTREGGEDADGPVESLRRAGLDLIEWRDFDGEWTRPPFDRASRIDALFAEMQALAARLQSPASPRDPLYWDTRPIRQMVDRVSRLETVAPRDYDGVEAELVALSRHRDLQRIRKGAGETYRPGAPREDVYRAVESARGSLAAFEMDANVDLAAQLKRDLRTLVAAYERAKAAAGALDFLDLLLEARDLLRDDADVRRAFQRRFTRIFVDEFQDTDPLQAEILLLLAADDAAVSEWRSVRPVPGKLFLVGDPKQSIYRFRRADVGVYSAVYAQLEAAGARRVTLRTSFRARPNIQRAINAAFAPAMTGDALSQQPGYVPLQPARPEISTQPTVVVLPVPQPYATQRVAATAIERSLPEAVGAWVHWLVRESGWLVEVRGQLVPIRAGHVCVLFRRFVRYGEDVTRAYVEELEARGIPHLLVGGRSFHNRAEVEALRAVLAAIERPDDELSVFASLRGPFFGVGDEELLQYRHRFGRLHPFHVPQELHDVDSADPELSPLEPIAEALRLIRSLHHRRNRVPVAATIGRLLDETRMHVRFALEYSGEQVLANVLRIADLARQYEAEGGISFRGFLDALAEQAESGEVSEAPILEEGSEGVRLMTVHKAKGLEFPVVILADMTAKLRPAAASRYLDQSRRLCAIRLAGCAPADLVTHGLLELERDRAEGVRVAYVAATRAQDLLVVPAVGDEERDGWLETLNGAIFPPQTQRRSPVPTTICPVFRSKDSVLDRPNGEPAGATTVSPGLHPIDRHGVVWWDPRALHLGALAPVGLRHADLIVKKDVPADALEAGLTEYRGWRAARERALAAGSSPGLAVQRVTDRARGDDADAGARHDVAVLRIDTPSPRPGGRIFGQLVHNVLAFVPLDAGEATIAALAASHARALGAGEAVIDAACERVRVALAHPLFDRARLAEARRRCRREVPIAWRAGDGVLLEGVADLAFEEPDGWVVVDFKTDEIAGATAAAYARQLQLYCTAIGQATGRPASGVLLYL